MPRSRAAALLPRVRRPPRSGARCVRQAGSRSCGRMPALRWQREARCRTPRRAPPRLPQRRRGLSSRIDFRRAVHAGTPQRGDRDDGPARLRRRRRRRHRAACRSAGISPIVIEMGSARVRRAAPTGKRSARNRSRKTPWSRKPHPPRCRAEAEAPEEESGTRPRRKPEPEKYEEEGLPPVEHVFLIVLGDHGYEEGFGASSQRPYLSQTLPSKGELLSNYYAVTKGDLANEVALLSGQGPTPATAANCPEYADVGPGTLNAEGQVEGDGCVYPAASQNVARSAGRQPKRAGRPTSRTPKAPPRNRWPPVARMPRRATRSSTSTRLSKPRLQRTRRRPRPARNRPPVREKDAGASPTSFPTPATTAAKRRAKPISQPGLPRRNPSWKRSCPRSKPRPLTKKVA